MRRTIGVEHKAHFGFRVVATLKFFRLTEVQVAADMHRGLGKHVQERAQKF